ncbi:MAG: ABC transporter permease [Thermoplasmata archaeon]
MWEGIAGDAVRSLLVSGCATLLASICGVPLGGYLGLKKMRRKGALKTIIYTFYGFPPVVMGLFIYLLLSSSGPLGFLHMLFTIPAMIIAEFLLAFPLVLGITMSAVASIPAEVSDAINVLGGSRWDTLYLHLREAKNGILAAVMVGFGSAISEVGAAMIVGGNIEGSTSVLTTSIMVSTRSGNFELALWLSLILLLLCLGIYGILAKLEEER